MTESIHYIDTMVEEMALPLGKTRRMCISSTFLLR